MKKILIGCIILMMFVSSCSFRVAENDMPISTAIVPQATVTPFAAEFESFDSSFKNFNSRNSSLIVVNGRAYFTTGRLLYCYNMDTDTKIEIADDLIVNNIHLVDDYVYFARAKNIKRINTKTDEVEVYYTAQEIVMALYDREFGYIKTSEEISDFFIYNEGYMRLVIGYETWYRKQIGDSSVQPLIDMGSGEMCDTRKTEWDYPTKENMYVYYDLQDNKQFYTVYRFVEPINEPKKMLFGGGDAVSFPFCVVERWPNSSFELAMYNQEMDEVRYRKNVNGACAVPKAFGQYLFVYYYDRMHSEQVEAEEGMVLYDAKNDIVYENEEINQIISGEINYTRLFHTDFYLDGDTLYVLENNLNEFSVSDLGYDEREVYKKTGFLIQDRLLSDDVETYEPGTFIDMPSEVNLYKAEVIDGRLSFNKLYTEFEPQN